MWHEQLILKLFLPLLYLLMKKCNFRANIYPWKNGFLNGFSSHGKTQKPLLLRNFIKHLTPPSTLFIIISWRKKIKAYLKHKKITTSDTNTTEFFDLWIIFTPEQMGGNCCLICTYYHALLLLLLFYEYRSSIYHQVNNRKMKKKWSILLTIHNCLLEAG